MSATQLIILLALALLSLLSYRFRATDGYGSIAAFAIGAVVGLAANWLWLLYLVLFFLTATLATKFRYDYKASLHAAEEKGGARGAINVLANGGLAAFFAILYWYFKIDLIAVFFVVSIASSLSDTLATEIGLLSRNKPRELLSLSSRVEPGRSGGITLLGIIAELAGSGFFALLAFLMNMVELNYIAIIILAGFIGANFDSLLGATLQGYYVCRKCGKGTERSYHCSEPAIKVKGISWIGNNSVNFLSCISAVLAAFILHLIL